MSSISIVFLGASSSLLSASTRWAPSTKLSFPPKRPFARRANTITVLRFIVSTVVREIAFICLHWRIEKRAVINSNVNDPIGALIGLVKTQVSKLILLQNEEILYIIKNAFSSRFPHFLLCIFCIMISISTRVDMELLRVLLSSFSWA